MLCFQYLPKIQNVLLGIFMILPKDIKNLLQYISPAVFKIISFREVGFKLIKMVNNRNPETMNQLKQDLTSSLPENLILQPFTSQLTSQTQLNDNQKTQIGEIILELYFTQLFSEKGVLLDLRPTHFGYETPNLCFEPGRLMHQFQSEFRNGILKIYKGFYGDEPDLLDEGLQDIGLLATGNSEDDRSQLISLLFAHFSNADHRPMLFKMDDFYQSFHQLFVFLKEKRQRIDSDFAFLGIYLVTLYLNLENLGVPLDVAASWEKALHRNS